MKKPEVRSVYSMSESKGWEYLEEFIETNVDSRKKELVNNEFELLEEVKELQAEVKAFKKVLNFVETRKQKYLKEANNG